jgi:hypothetical protein
MATGSDLARVIGLVELDDASAALGGMCLGYRVCDGCARATTRSESRSAFIPVRRPGRRSWRNRKALLQIATVAHLPTAWLKLTQNAASERPTQHTPSAADQSLRTVCLSGAQGLCTESAGSGGPIRARVFGVRSSYRKSTSHILRTNRCARFLPAAIVHSAMAQTDQSMRPVLTSQARSELSLYFLASRQLPDRPPPPPPP